MKITILGARGSIPTEGEDMLEFGGATSCVLVETENNAVILDAGTGIMDTPDIGNKPISLLLTHPHLDHILGLPFFPYISKKGRKIDFYTAPQAGLSSREQLDRFFSPPLWPCSVDDYPAIFDFHEIEFPLNIGEIQVDGIPSVHPGGGMVYKLSAYGRSFVYATDYEYEERKVQSLIEFAKDTDLLLFDAQYTEEEFEKRRGFGHSTAHLGMSVAKACGAKAVRFVHHDPLHTDEILRKMEAEVKTDKVRFARRGEVIEI